LACGPAARCERAGVRLGVGSRPPVRLRPEVGDDGRGPPVGDCGRAAAGWAKLGQNSGGLRALRGKKVGYVRLRLKRTRGSGALRQGAEGAPADLASAGPKMNTGQKWYRG
jgi:hypothetical protein